MNAEAGGRHLVHIGYHKTGSTWLHRMVFPAIEGYHSTSGDPLFRALLRNLRTAADEEFTPSAFAAAVEECSGREHTPLLLGNESLSGDVWAGGAGWRRNAERLARVLPEAAVLIVIRRQPEMLLSLYAQYVQEGGTGPLDDFLDGVASSCRFDPAHLRYDGLIQAYTELFGAESVCVLPFELLQRSPEGFLAQLGSLLRTRVREIGSGRENPSLSAGSLRLLRAWNRAFRVSKFNRHPSVFAIPGGRSVRRVMQRRVDPMLRRFRAAARLPAATRERIETLAASYADSNALTQSSVEIDLAELGYPLLGVAASRR